MSLDRKDVLSKTFELIDSHLQNESTSQKIPYFSPDELRNTLDIGLGDRADSFDSVLEKIKHILKYTPMTGSPVFFNQLFAGKDLPALAGDLVSTALNTSMYTYKAAGAQILVENEVINKMLSISGFDKGEGTLVPGGSMSNLTAILAAMDRVNPDHSDNGGDGRRYVAYTSEECHYSLKKNMGILGLGRNNMRYCKADSEGKLDTTDLKRLILEDRKKGYTPFLVVATSGTTVRGAFDNLDIIGEVAREENLWFHVDGAFGASMLLHSSADDKFYGLEKADSLTWDPHKMLGSTLLASAILFREKGTLFSILNENASYLFQTEENPLNPGTQSLQCGRRNDALKIWTAWKYYGDDGYNRLIEKQLSLAKYAATKAANSDDYELIFEPTTINVCFNHQQVDPKAICSFLDKSGDAKIGYGSSGETTFIRLVTANPELDDSDIDNLFSNIDKSVKSILSEMGQ